MDGSCDSHRDVGAAQDGGTTGAGACPDGPDIATGRLCHLGSIHVPLETAHECVMCFGPHGERLWTGYALVSRSCFGVATWCVATQRRLSILPLPAASESPTCIAASHGGANGTHDTFPGRGGFVVMAIKDSNLLVLDEACTTYLFEIKAGFSEYATALAVSQDNTKVAALGFGYVHICDVHARSCVRRVPAGSLRGYTTMAFLPSSPRLAVVNPTFTHVRLVTTGDVLWSRTGESGRVSWTLAGSRLDQRVGALAASPCGSMLAYIDSGGPCRTVVVCDTETRRTLHEIRWFSPYLRWCRHRRGSFLAGGVTSVWRVTRDSIVRLPSPDTSLGRSAHQPLGMALSSSGVFVASVHPTEGVVVTRAATGEVVGSTGDLKTPWKWSRWRAVRAQQVMFRPSQPSVGSHGPSTVRGHVMITASACLNKIGVWVASNEPVRSGYKPTASTVRHLRSMPQALRRRLGLRVSIMLRRPVCNLARQASGQLAACVSKGHLRGLLSAGGTGCERCDAWSKAMAQRYPQLRNEWAEGEPALTANPVLNQRLQDLGV